MRRKNVNPVRMPTLMFPPPEIDSMYDALCLTLSLLPLQSSSVKKLGS